MAHPLYHGRRETPLARAPASLQRSMARIGPIWSEDIERHASLVFDAYTPLLRSAPRDDVVVTRDIPYGTHPRQVVDVYHVPSNEPARLRPVVMFVHGGAFTRGERDRTPEIFGNVLTWFARQGCVGVNVEYRLAPESVFPGGARDVGSAVDWTRGHIAQFGGDASRILLIGHSAGGAHVASYAFDAAARGEATPRIAGQVLISARVRADQRPDNPNAAGVRAYFGDDPRQYEARSPITHAEGSAVSTMMVVAEFESPLLDVYALDLFHVMSRSAPPVLRFVRLDRHNHVSIVAHFDTEEEILGREILDFLANLPLSTAQPALGTAMPRVSSRRA